MTRDQSAIACCISPTQLLKISRQEKCAAAMAVAARAAKPTPGRLLPSGARYGVPLSGICFVGDSGSDLEKARAVDCLPVRMKTGKGPRTLANALPAGTLVFDDLAAVAAQRLT